MTLREFPAQIQQTADDSMVPVRIIASEDIAKLPREQADSRLSALLHQVRVRPDFIWYGFRTLASYVTPLPRAALYGHNTLVELSLPYTLHLPSEMPFQVTRPQPTGRATIVLRKIWTDLAVDSNDAEIYADDQLLYYGPAQPSTPTIPQAPELGPWPRFTGTNVEIAKDTHGVFRYTRICIFFDSTVAGIGGSASDDTVQAARSAALDEATEAATKAGLDIVNYLLDVYRCVTGAEHVERLPTITVNRVYFADHNFVSEGARIHSGLGSAIVNRSRHEIERIKEMLSAGEEPEQHVLLIQSARAALDRGQLVLAVVVAFQALEILLETKLRAGYAHQGLSEDDVTDKLKRCYKTRDRLTVLCREVTGEQCVADDSTFWNSWLTDCNRKRNGVVHRNEAVTPSEALKIVDLCEQCIARLSALPFPA